MLGHIIHFFECSKKRSGEFLAFQTSTTFVESTLFCLTSMEITFVESTLFCLTSMEIREMHFLEAMGCSQTTRV
jgi:hypothetical protein